MNTSQNAFSELKKILESCAFMVSQGQKPQDIHAKIISALVIIAQAENSTQKTKEPVTSSTKESLSVVKKPIQQTHVEVKTGSELEQAEVKKVIRRLKLWAKRPQQINSQILTAYLSLQDSGKKYITEEDIFSLLPNEKTFTANFTQMKIIADRNHGKIFDQNDGQITIWPPIAKYVDEFKRNTTK